MKCLHRNTGIVSMSLVLKTNATCSTSMNITGKTETRERERNVSIRWIRSSRRYSLRERTPNLFEHPETVGQLKALLNRTTATVQHRQLPGKNVDNQNIFFSRYVYDNRAKRILKNPTLNNPTVNLPISITTTTTTTSVMTTMTSTATATQPTTTISVPTATHL